MYLIDLQSLFEPIRSLVKVSFVTSHHSKTQITCKAKIKAAFYCTNMLSLMPSLFTV